MSEDDSNEEITSNKSDYSPLNTAFPSDKHINLFEDFEQKVWDGKQ